MLRDHIVEPHQRILGPSRQNARDPCWEIVLFEGPGLTWSVEVQLSVPTFRGSNRDNNSLSGPQVHQARNLLNPLRGKTELT